MRLIDGDNIRGCANYIEINEDFEPYIMIDDLVKLLDEQPTAYSVDKVVEELEKEKIKKAWEYEDRMYNCAVDEAIEIVKQGGVSDDVCEWESVKLNYWWKPSCEPNSTYNVFGVAWFKRCPYCGKKIKIVGDLYGMV